MDSCPQCRRRLLSHISARCNWCGVEIEDPDYRAQAEVERAAFRAEDARHSLQTLTLSQSAYNNTRAGWTDGNYGVPLVNPSDAAALVSQRAEYEAWEQARLAAVIHAQQTQASAETSAEKPGDEVHSRFGHLEL